MKYQYRINVTLEAENLADARKKFEETMNSLEYDWEYIDSSREESRQKFFNRLEKEFPGHEFGVIPLAIDEFTVKSALVIDGNITDIMWSPEQIQDLVAIQGVVTEDVIMNEIIKDVREVI